MPENVYIEGNYPGFYNRYYSDDYLEATIDNKYRMKMAEITTEHIETTDSNGNRHTEITTIFSGIFAKINIGKMFEAVINKKDALNKDIILKYYNVVYFIYSLSRMMIKVVEDTQI